MKPTHPPIALPDATVVCCDVAAHGIVRATSAELPGLRQCPGPAVGEPLPASFLKHSDEQTVAGLAAVFQAIHQGGLKGTCFTDWGVLGAPRFLGRVLLAATLQRFATEGAWGISPHLVPHRSLHAVAGTVSQALKIHGPNFGVGGGPGGVSEALLTSVALLHGDQLPGVWLILTGWDPEPVTLQGQENPPSVPVCCAVALALAAVRPGSKGLRLRIVSRSSSTVGAPETLQAEDTGPFRLALMLETLTQPGTSPLTLSWGLNGGVGIELERLGGAHPALHGPHYTEHAWEQPERTTGAENKL